MEEPKTVEEELGTEKQDLETPTFVRMAKKTEETSKSKKRTITRAKFSKTLLEATLTRPFVSGYIETYLENGYSFRYEEHYSYQTNLYFLPAAYQTYVSTIINDVCICRWPLTVRYLVFPRIYGFYTNERVIAWLENLYNLYPLNTIVAALEEGLVEKEKEEKLDLIEKLSSQNAIKNLVDENLIDQTGKLLEAQELKEDIHRLFDNVLTKYNLVTESDFIDKELHLDDLIDSLKKKLGDDDSDDDKKKSKKAKKSKKSKKSKSKTA